MQPLSKLLAPDTRRTFPGLRPVRTLTRSLHIPAFGVVIGAWWLGEPAAAGVPWAVTVVTGAVLLGLFLFESAVFLLELRGVAVIAKLAALATLPHLSVAAGTALLVVLAVGASVASHMPGRYRHLRVDKWRRSPPEPKRERPRPLDREPR